MSPIRSRRRAGSRTEKSPSRAELSAASSASRLSMFAPVPSTAPAPLLAPFAAGAAFAAVFVPLVARLAVAARRRPDAGRLVVDDAVLAAAVDRFEPSFLAAGFWVADLAAAPVLADLVL